MAGESVISNSQKYNIILSRTKGSSEKVLKWYAPLPPKSYRAIPRRLLRYLVYLAKNKTHNVDVVKLAISAFPDDAIMQSYVIEYYWTLRLGLKKVPASNYRKLSPEEVREVVRLRSEGKSIYEIAKELGRHTSTIYYVLRRLNIL